MLSQIWMASALCAVALAAPSLAPGAAARPEEMKVLSQYFQMLATKVQAGKMMGMVPVCDLSKAVLPVAAPTNLPLPSAGMSLKHVAIGRGTQNYTCSQTNATAAPTAVGAVATLFNASCVASTYPDLLAMIPKVALEFNMTANQKILSPSNLAISGQHYFTNLTTPLFDLDTTAMKLGVAPCQKNSSIPAPTDAPVGQNGLGLGAVPWLKLTTRSGATGDLAEVYRVNTAGGSPPKVCAGMPETFQVEYAAEWPD
ncbi:hypothetical protein M7I_3731 [Glarea lozoyensis 74030]|uniref:Malate dehydrogenase n=1 Tax=Glarea lozoyensis (strain ATCC 74030 / MF5533) TaxID=1104152 RepID=H0EMA1_GLAL7|nr:hypothetical protein M7I_3731 [Glarea lozoyensis 74030]